MGTRPGESLLAPKGTWHEDAEGDGIVRRGEHEPRAETRLGFVTLGDQQRPDTAHPVRPRQASARASGTEGRGS